MPDPREVLARIDATLAGIGGVTSDASVPGGMRWAPEQPPPDPTPLAPGAWAEAVLEEARARNAVSIADLYAVPPDPFTLRGLTVESQPKPLTMAELEAIVQAHQPAPPTQLKCHPSVIEALISAHVSEPSEWPWPPVPRDLVQIDVIADTGMAPGAWELSRGDEVVGEGVIRS